MVIGRLAGRSGFFRSKILDSALHYPSHMAAEAADHPSADPLTPLTVPSIGQASCRNQVTLKYSPLLIRIFSRPYWADLHNSGRDRQRLLPGSLIADVPAHDTSEIDGVSQGFLLTEGTLKSRLYYYQDKASYSISLSDHEGTVL